jgi:hypothetical protein
MTTTILRGALYLPHPERQLLVELLSVGAGMDAAVTVRAQCDHVSWIIRTTIAESADVMRFEVGHSIRPHEWSIALASFAATCTTSDNVVPDVSTALDDGRGPARPTRRHESRRFKRQPAKLFQSHIVRDRCLFERFLNGLKWLQLKDDRLPHVAVAIGSLFQMMSDVDVCPFEAQTCIDLTEKQQVTTIAVMGGDGSVSALHLHITPLALAEVFERAIGQLPIGIAVNEAFFSCDQDNQREVLGCDNAALLLASETRVYIRASVVDASPLETPHAIPHHTKIDQATSGLAAERKQVAL